MYHVRVRSCLLAETVHALIKVYSHRYRAVKSSTNSPPAPMPSSEEADLVRHLQEVHPAGWNNLRNQ